MCAGQQLQRLIIAAYLQARPFVLVLRLQKGKDVITLLLQRDNRLRISAVPLSGFRCEGIQVLEEGALGVACKSCRVP